MTVAEPIAVTLEFAHGLEQLGLDYAVGGSIASSLHGVPRSTQDIDERAFAETEAPEANND